MLVDIFGKMGFEAKMPDGTFFLYMKAPKGIAGGEKFVNAEACSQYLIRNHLISTVPEDTAGNYLRASATFLAPTQEEMKKRSPPKSRNVWRESGLNSNFIIDNNFFTSKRRIRCLKDRQLHW